MLLLRVRDRLFVRFRLDLSRCLLLLRLLLFLLLVLVLRLRLLLLNERLDDLLRFLPLSGCSDCFVVEDERFVDEVDADESLEEEDVEREWDKLEEVRRDECFDDEDFERADLIVRFLKLELLSSFFSLFSVSFFSFGLSFVT